MQYFEIYLLFVYLSFYIRAIKFQFTYLVVVGTDGGGASNFPFLQTSTFDFIADRRPTDNYYCSPQIWPHFQ